MEKGGGGGVGGGGLEIRVPRPEDAGLEDCALSPGSIMEAFARAAAVSFGSCLSIQEPQQHEDDNGPTNTENHKTMADKEVVVSGGEEAVRGDAQSKQGKDHDK